MKVLGRDDSLTALLDPLGLRETLTLRTVPIAAGIVGGCLVSALSADVQVPAQGGGPTALDGCHHFALLERRDYLSR
jgi:hypothetical protein